MDKFYFHHWQRASPQAVIVLVHGLGEYCERYEWAASQFVEQGYAVLGVDLPGHGKSALRQGHVRSFSEFLDAVDEQISRAESLYPGVPLILFGHSMGGLVIVRYLQIRKRPASVRAVLLSSPSLQTANPISGTQLRLAGLLSRVWPTFLQSAGIRAENVTRSPEIRVFYASSDRVLHRFSVRLLTEFFQAMDAAIAFPTRIDVPILVAQAGEDKLVSVATNRAFVDNLVAADKQYKVYPDCYHELLNEPERETIFAEMTAWLDAHFS